MGKTLGSWSGMRKYLEQEMLADSLKGRIRYGCTSYPGMDGCRIFEVWVDGKQVKRFSWETVNTYFIKSGLTYNRQPIGFGEYWSEFWTMLEQYPITERTEYTDDEFCEALKEYRNQNILESLQSENPNIRMFAVLDRRVGKRTLANLLESVNLQPEWLQLFYKLRFHAELV